MSGKITRIEKIRREAKAVNITGMVLVAMGFVVGMKDFIASGAQESLFLGLMVAITGTVVMATGLGISNAKRLQLLEKKEGGSWEKGQDPETWSEGGSEA